MYTLKKTFKVGEQRGEGHSEAAFTKTRPKTETIKAFSRRTFLLPFYSVYTITQASPNTPHEQVT